MAGHQSGSILRARALNFTIRVFSLERVTVFLGLVSEKVFIFTDFSQGVLTVSLWSGDQELRCGIVSK